MTQPEYMQIEEFKLRLLKLQEIEALGINPFPHRFHTDSSCQDLHSKFEGKELGSSDDAQAATTEHVVVSGRLVLFRAMGKNAFAHIQDASGRIQIMCNRDSTAVQSLPEGESAIKFIEKKIDLGDIIGVEGHLFRTHKGELTIFVKKLVLLSKSLLPLPDKHGGLTDKGTRYRKRWLDLIANPEVKEAFILRSKMIKLVRDYYHSFNFMEVETPVLQNIYGGAEARPFTTTLNALDQEMYLRISLEISLKKLIIGGLPRIFEIGKVFRNEGIDRTHNPEFTMIESYAENWDYNDVMVFTENLFAYIAQNIFGTTKIGIRKDKAGNEHEIDLKTPWKRMSMKEAIQIYGKIDVDHLSDSQLGEILLKAGVSKEELPTNRGLLIAALFEEFVEHHLIQPHHITDHPIETTPLCKLHRNEQLRKERIVERFESFILGFEFCNAYSELNDPVLQRSLLEEQAAKRLSGDEEASPMDEEFLEAICQGMPPTGGLGIGIDRMAMLFTGVHSIRDVLFFPLMKPGE